jgi:hypothetical protein
MMEIQNESSYPRLSHAVCRGETILWDAKESASECCDATGWPGQLALEAPTWLPCILIDEGRYFLTKKPKCCDDIHESLFDSPPLTG